MPEAAIMPEVLTLESENGPQGVCEFQKLACSGGICVHVFVCLFFFNSMFQVGSQSRYETTAPES